MRLLSDDGDQLLDDTELDIGLQQGKPDIAHRIGDVRFANLGLATEFFEGVFEFFLECCKHEMGKESVW